MLSTIVSSIEGLAMTSKYLFIIFASVSITGFGGMFSSGTIPVVTGLDEHEANEILVLLDSYSISAEKKELPPTGNSKISTWTLSVRPSKKMETLSILNMHGRPRKKTSSTLLSLFNKQGLVSSEMEEKIRYQAGLADQIANTIRKLEGVLDADVQLSIPPDDNILGISEQKRVTASVYIKHQGVLDDPNSHLEIKVKKLIANSIPELTPENVTVVGDRAVINSDNVERSEVVSIWGIFVEKESTFRLKFILIFMIVISAISVILDLFLVWKLQDFLKTKNGIFRLLSFSPLEVIEKNDEDDNTIIEQKMKEEKATVDSTPEPEAPTQMSQPNENRRPPRR